MNQKDKVFVPISAKALVLTSDEELLDLKTRSDELFLLGKNIKPTLNTTYTLESGIHLHWTLPKELMHGTIDEGGEINFPEAPDRWLVVRIKTNKGKNTDIETKKWIVQSNVIVTDEDSDSATHWVTLVKDGDNTKYDLENYIGKSMEWQKDYKELDSSEQVSSFHGVGAMSPMFSSIYSESRFVFGFHDDTLNDQDKGSSFSYVITGWYSNETKDPLYKKDEREKNLASWFKDVSKDLPNTSLYHATLQNIIWSETVENEISDKSVDVFVGNTSVEAISALMCKDNEEDSLETLLSSLQYQLLEDATRKVEIQTLIQENYKRAFTPKKYGVLWEVIRLEEEGMVDDNTSGAKPQFPEEKNLIKDLETLNKIQKEYNKNSYFLKNKRQEYYLNWQKIAENPSEGGFDIDNSSFKKIEKAIDELSLKISDDLQEITKQILAIEKKYKSISLENTNRINTSTEKKEGAMFKLSERLEDRFWEPNDPVIMLEGSGLGNPSKQALHAITKGRVLSNLILDLEIKYEQESPCFIMSKEHFKFKDNALSDLENPNIPYESIQNLIYESLLLNNNMAISIAKDVLSVREVNTRVKEFSDDVIVNEYQNNPKDVSLGKIYPMSKSVRNWEFIWEPIFMKWEVTYTKGFDYLKDKGFKVPQTSEQSYQNKKQDKNSVVKFKGFAPLTNSVFQNLTNYVSKDLVGDYKNVLSQTIGGFQKALVNQEVGIQFPPFKYDGNVTDHIIDHVLLNKVFGNETETYDYGLGSLTQQETLRYGNLKIKKLSIVDAFGKEKVIITAEHPKELTLSKVICQVEKNKSLSIPMTPRFTDPARLQFHWTNLKNEIVSQDFGSLNHPVIGWVIPNFLDRQLMVYDGDGREVKILQVTSDVTKNNGYGFQSHNFPGDISEKIKTNIHLTNWLNGIKTGEEVVGFLTLAEKTQAKNKAIEEIPNTSSLLYGEPIALAKCQLSIEVLQSPNLADVEDISLFEVPLNLGDFSIKDDGLLGYYTDDYLPEKNSLKRCNLTHKITDVEHLPDYFKVQEPLYLKPNTKPKELILLCQASTSIHLNTALLPSKKMYLYKNSVQKLLERVNNSFMIAPFIGDQEKPGVPTPNIMNTEWKFIHQSGVNTWEGEQETEESKSKQNFTFSKQQIYEGWIKISNIKEHGNGK